MTASSDTKPAFTKSSSRRALLAGALGGIGAVAAGAMAKVSPVQAANGDAVTVGGTFTGTSTTSVVNNNALTVFLAGNYGSGTALSGASTGGVGAYGTSGTSHGVRGESDSSSGVYGSSNSGNGVVGISDSGYGVSGYSGAVNAPAVQGFSGGGGTGLLGSSGASPAPKPKTGVYGYANQDSGSKGVYGFSGRGAGLYGQANKNGYAVRAKGRIKADKVSGVKTISAGLTSVTLNPGVKVTSSSFVLLTPRANIGSRGLWYTTNPGAGTITIHLSSSRSSSTKIGWLLLG